MSCREKLARVAERIESLIDGLAYDMMLRHECEVHGKLERCGERRSPDWRAELRARREALKAALEDLEKCKG